MTLPLTRRFYDNYIVYGPSGEAMFRCSEKRRDWYLSHGLAALVHEGPDGTGDIRLTFIPNGPGCANDPFYLQEMVNRCVVCGAHEQLSRRFIIPLSYRRWFPPALKNSSHHDIVLMCSGCHQQYDVHMREMCSELCHLFGVSEQGWVHDPRGHQMRMKAKGAAKTLLSVHVDKIPADRIKFLRGEITRAYMGVDISKRSVLEWVASSLPKPAVDTPGKLLVDRFGGDAKLLLRHVIWPFRAMFISAMKPGFLPEGWSIQRSER